MAVADIRSFGPEIPLSLSPELANLLAQAPRLTVASNVHDLEALAVRHAKNGVQEVGYFVPGSDAYRVEARVCRVRNGIAANYTEEYQRRRDPDCMFIADSLPSDKPRFDATFPVRESGGFRA